MSLKRNIQYVFIANIIMIFLNALVYPMVLNIYKFSTIEFGHYQKYLTILTIVSSFIYFSLDITYISETHVHTQKEKDYFFTFLLSILIVNIIICNIIIKILKIDINIISISMLILTSNLFQLLIIILKDEKELKKSSFILVQQNIINLLILLVLGYFFRTYKIFIYGNIISNIYSIIRLYIVTKVKLDWNIQWIKNFLKNNSKKIKYKFITNISEKNYEEVPILIFINNFQMAIIGSFNIGYKLLGIGNKILASALTETILSHVSKSIKDREIIIDNFKNLIVFFSVIYIGVSSFSDFYLKFIVGENYLDISKVIKYLCPLLALAALVSPYTNFFIIENRTKEEMYLNISFLFIRIGSIYFFSKKLDFYNLLLIYVIVGSIRYLVLAFFIFKNKKEGLKCIIYCIFFTINLFLNIYFFKNIFFIIYIIVVYIIFGIKTFKLIYRKGFYVK